MGKLAAAVAIGLVSVAGTTAVRAQPTTAAPTLGPAERAAAEAERGAAAYAAGDYAAAATAFDAAYQLDPLTTYLFNRAQAERLAERCAAAGASYELYLAREPAASNRAEVEAWIAQQRQCVEATTAPVDPPPPPPPVTVQRRSRAWRLAGGGLIAGGAIGVGVGVLGLMTMGDARGDIDALYADGTWSPADATAYDDAVARGERGELMTWLGLGAGLASITAGALLIVLAPSHTETLPLVTATADGAMVSFGRAF